MVAFLYVARYEINDMIKALIIAFIRLEII